MTHRYFLFFAGFLSFLCLLAYPISQLGSSIHVVVAGILVVAVGIPHGAIDHIIYQTKSKVSPVKFYASYFAAMLFGALCWYIFPQVSFLVFLLLSAFHFGQSQFVQTKSSWALKNIIYFSWGLSLLSGIIYYRFQELTLLAVQYPDLAILHRSLNMEMVLTFLQVSTMISVLLFSFFLWKGVWDLKVFLKEMILFILLHFTFYLLPFLVGFVLYFTVFHSLVVLGQEYHFLKVKMQVRGVKHFIQLLAPYTFISLVGLSLGIALVYYRWVSISYFLLLIVFISVLTVPHSVVMDKFYDGFKGVGNGKKKATFDL